jgi:hypothetical protein
MVVGIIAKPQELEIDVDPVVLDKKSRGYHIAYQVSDCHHDLTFDVNNLRKSEELVGKRGMEIMLKIFRRIEEIEKVGIRSHSLTLYAATDIAWEQVDEKVISLIQDVIRQNKGVYFDKLALQEDLQILNDILAKAEEVYYEGHDRRCAENLDDILGIIKKVPVMYYLNYKVEELIERIEATKENRIDINEFGRYFANLIKELNHKYKRLLQIIYEEEEITEALNKLNKREEKLQEEEKDIYETLIN